MDSERQRQPTFPTSAGRSREYWSFPQPVAWMVLAISLAATGGGWLLARQHEELAARKRFDEAANRIAQTLAERMTIYEDVLYGAAGLFAASQSVERSEWKAYVESVSIEKRFPGVDGLGYVARVPREQLAAFLEIARADKTPGFTLKNPGTNDELFIIKYLEPEERYRDLIGLNNATDPELRSVAEQARDTGEATLSALVTLRDAARDRQTGLMMFLPVYRHGADTASVAERRAGIEGWVYARFVAAELMRGIFGTNVSSLRFQLRDGAETLGGKLIFDSDPEPESPPPGDAAKFTAILQLPLDGRIWNLRCRTKPGFDRTIARGSEIVAGAGGGFISLLLFGIAWSLSSTRERALHIASDMTTALREANEKLQKEILERQHSEESLQHERFLLRTLMDNLPDRIYFKDQASRFLRNSRAHLERFGLTDAAQATGKTDFDFFSDEHARQAFDDEQDLMRTGRTVTKEERETWPDGSVSWALSTKLPLRDESGKTIGTFGISHDITARKNAEEALRVAKEAAEEASRTKSQFLASMSHELRTPLNSVIGFSNILLKNKNHNLTAAELTFLDRIAENGKHLLALINEILDLSKIEAHKVELQVEPVALDALVRETVAEQQGLVRDKPVQLLTELPATVALCPTDPDKLRQIIINLIGNALKFTEQGSVTVRVVTDPANQHPLRIEVSDTGIGIAQEKLGLIFEAFQQAETGTARKYGGTGLGLTISQALCRLLGYHITVASEVGRGSTFSVVLSPTPEIAAGISSVAPTSKPTLRPAAKSTLPGKRVLVIDDDADSRTLLGHLITDCGCQVVSASSGAQGLQMAREFRPDLITLDLMMPSMDGWQVARAIKADPELSHIPVVIVSIVAAENRGQIFGVVDVLQKPVARQELLDTLQRVLPRARPRILVVDDDPDFHRVIAAQLHGEVAEIRDAFHGREALQVLENFSPDLVLLDLTMPEMNGMSFLAALRRDARHQKLPVVVVTAKDLTAEEAGELKRETLRVLNKAEVFAGELKRVLEELLPGHAAK